MTEKRMTQKARVREAKRDLRADLARLDEEIAADAAKAAPAPDILSRITTNGETLLKLRKELELAEVHVSDLQKQIREMEQTTLPSLFDEAGISIVGLEDADGHVMQRAEEVYASISQANAAAAADWLIKNGFGAIVKTKINMQFEKEEVKLIKHVESLLDKEAIAYQESSAVHAATLKAFVKERLAAGTMLPPSITVHVQPIVTVKVPKKR